MKDLYNDNSFKTLLAMTRKWPHMRGTLEKCAEDAADEDVNSLPKTAFADQTKRMFPIHTKSAAFSSFAYAKDQGAPEAILTKIGEALELWGMPWDTLDKTFDRLSDFELQKESTDNNFLLPKYGSYPVHNEHEVYMAVEYFDKQGHSLHINDRIEYCNNLVKTAAELDMDLNSMGTEVLQYAGLTGTDFFKLSLDLENRVLLCERLQKRASFRDAYYKIASKLPNRGEALGHPEDFNKLAESLLHLDTMSGLSEYYTENGRRYDNCINNPYLAIFNLDKVAEASLSVAGTNLSISKLVSLPKDALEAVLGGDLAKEVYSGGSLDLPKLKAILPTLPMDMKANLARQVKQL
jgi:hypothetical protein